MANGRNKVSDRTFIDAQGNEVDRMEEATGARYTLTGIGKSFDVQMGEAGQLPTMFAIFGFWTKVGNVANTTLNDKDDPGTPEDAASRYPGVPGRRGGRHLARGRDWRGPWAQV